ncbi:hypothetical protein Hanom_Chr01g00047231 [Helianthus anomalus]
MITMLQVLMSSSKSGLSEEHDPMAIVSDDDEVAPAPEVFTSDTNSDPDMISNDEDDFQPFALPDIGDDVPNADDVLIYDIFALPIPIHDHLIIGHPDGEHLVAPIPIDVVPLAAIPPEDWPFDDLLDDDFDIFASDHPAGEQGDGEVDDVIVLDVSPPVVPVIDISSDSSVYSVADSFEYVTSSALQAAGLRLYATDDDDDEKSAAPLSLIRAPTPPHVPNHVHDPDPVPFGISCVAPLVPKPVSAPLDLPPIAPVVTQPPPVDVVPPHFVSDEHRTDLPIVFQQEIPAPRPGEGTSGQPPSFDPFASADFPPIPQFTSFASDLYEQFRWFLPYTMPISNPYHPSHQVGYTRDDFLLSLQLQLEILSRRVLELELTPSYPPPVPPFPFLPPPAASTSTMGFDARFLTVEQ